MFPYQKLTKKSGLCIKNRPVIGQSIACTRLWALTVVHKLKSIAIQQNMLSATIIVVKKYFSIFVSIPAVNDIVYGKEFLITY